MGSGGEILSRACFDDVFEHTDEGFEVFYGHVEVVFDAAFFFYFVDGGFKRGLFRGLQEPRPLPHRHKFG